MGSFFLRQAAVALALVFGGAALADSMVPVTLSPITHSDAKLTVSGSDGTTITYSVSDLEGFATYRIQTVTPWRSEAATFEGVLLSDVLAASNLDQVNAIRVTAENDFTSDIDRQVWDSVPVMIATRVDGQAISRRERGPLLFVVDDTTYQASSTIEERHLVWMAARIEPLL